MLNKNQKKQATNMQDLNCGSISTVKTFNSVPPP